MELLLQGEQREVVLGWVGVCRVLVSFGKEMTAGEGNCFQKRGSYQVFSCFFSCAMGEYVAATGHYSVLDTLKFFSVGGGGVRGQQIGMSNLQHADAEVRQEEGGLVSGARKARPRHSEQSWLLVCSRAD